MIYQSWRAFGGGDDIAAVVAAELLPGAIGSTCVYNITGCFICRASMVSVLHLLAAALQTQAAPGNHG